MAYDFEKWVANDLRKVKRHRWLPPFLGVMMVVMGLSGVLESFDNGADAEHLPSLVTLTLALLIPTLSSPFARDAWIGPRMDKMFDEFERDALARATSRAYSVMMILLLVLFAWLWLANVNGWPLPRTPLDWSSIGFAFVGIGLTLPIFFAEIMVPLPPADDASDA